MLEVYVRIKDVDWDFDDDEIDESVPTDFVIPVYIDDETEEELKARAEENGTNFKTELHEYLSEELVDMVSDEYGYCHNGFDFEIIETANNDFGRAKEILNNLISYLADLKDHEGTEEWNDFWKEIAELNDGEMLYYDLNRDEE